MNTKANTNNSETLEGTTNMYGGITITPAQLPPKNTNFKEILVNSINRWRNENLRLVWLEIPVDLASFVPIAVDLGFSYHHAQKNTIMMTLPLSKDTHIPNYATHNLGAGAVVINENNELLVVNERFRRDQTKPYYKLPGGAVDPAENISKAAEREVMEETGIYTQFIGIVCLRHRHGFRFGTSDLYIVCRLKPLSKEITSDPHEIEDCKWMPLTNYFSSDYVADFNKKIVQLALQSTPLQHAHINDGQDYEFLSSEKS